MGIGFDIHRLAQDRPLVLGGVAIPFPLGLEGHSDADVLIHALMDALLGAAGLRDIGHYFPPGEPRFRNISSLELLREVKKLVAGEGYRVVNADMVVIAEAPRLAPFIGAMKEKMAPVLELSESALSVKATTAEGLGVCGRGEAIAAYAAVLLQARS